MNALNARQMNGACSQRAGWGYLPGHVKAWNYGLLIHEEPGSNLTKHYSNP